MVVVAGPGGGLARWADRSGIVQGRVGKMLFWRVHHGARVLVQPGTVEYSLPWCCAACLSGLAEGCPLTDRSRVGAHPADGK
jgi:hypothetical protein